MRRNEDSAAIPLLTIALQQESDVVSARQRARLIARLVGFESQDQSRITTAVSEITRNAIQYAGGGRIEFQIEPNPTARTLVIRVSDSGKGIARLDEILNGQYVSSTGMGLGIIGAKRLMDSLTISTAEDCGTEIVLKKSLPRRGSAMQPLDVGEISAELARIGPPSPFDEVQQQNRDMVRALDELQARQSELDQLNRELSDTNRGVMALYAELDEKAQQLQRANDLKSTFLSNISHEFRTPLNSIMGLARLLQERVDGDLTPEQEKQIKYIHRAAEALSILVNDLLDTAKIDAGKLVIYSQEFTVSDLFSSLRGMFRPLLLSGEVSLHFENVDHLPPLNTDEGKVAQILRNFISNALKFTERGTVRVSATLDGADKIVFSVADEGIGIAAEDQRRIFADFGQIDGAVQRKVQGTGLGLPLSRRLAELLGGCISVTSKVGAGSTFSAALPRCYTGPEEVNFSGREIEQKSNRLSKAGASDV